MHKYVGVLVCVGAWVGMCIGVHGCMGAWVRVHVGVRGCMGAGLGGTRVHGWGGAGSRVHGWGGGGARGCMGRGVRGHEGAWVWERVGA